MNPNSLFVAVAHEQTKRISVNGKWKNTKTIFYNGKVVAHHPKSKCLKGKIRMIHQNMLLAIIKANKVDRCEECWNNRSWAQAQRKRKTRKKISPMDKMLQELDELDL